MRFFIKTALNKNPAIHDELSLDYLKTEGMIGLPEAVRNIHFPKSKNILIRARYRLKFEELYQIKKRGLEVKKALARKQAYSIKTDSKILAKFYKNLPYELTSEQARAAEELNIDLQKTHPMNRILIGDVGSGKTVVAMIGILSVVLEGWQAAIMAPTEILAYQHFNTFIEFFKDFDVKVMLFTRNYKEIFYKGKRRISTDKEIKKEIEEGGDQVIIGTHKLIQPSVKFAKLALVVVDEQHRFGVNQRLLLTRQGKDDVMPHFFSLTATPIPRTYAQLLYCGLDVSLLEHIPPGRKQIITNIINQNDVQKTYNFIKEEIKKGRQMFVICPLIMESDMLGVEAVITEEAKLQKVFQNFNIEVLHGRLSGSAKENVMADFAKGSIDILISTAVVEVGIDVPNASLMMIESPERFGLSQLHQFRGRIGRGKHQSHCFLIVGVENIKNKRLLSLAKIDNGFKLSEIDLKTRGPGEIYGLRQSGFLNLKIATLSDVKIMKKVQELLN